MHAKVLAPLLAFRVQPAQKFPQVRLKAQEHRRVTHHRHCLVPLSAFHEDSVAFATRELTPGRIVELRRDDNRLIALGFFEPQLQRVDVFELTPKQVSMLPTISEDLFLARVHEAWERRHRLLHQSQNNTYRIVNGYVDGLPSLYVDIFSESFVRVIATSQGAERLVPGTVDFLRRRGAEDILLDTPTLGSDVRLPLAKPTMAMPNIYVEGGIRHFWLKEGVHPPSLENRLLVNPAHRRSRRLIRDLGRGRRVLCINDRSGSATMNAVMTAKHVTVVDEDADAVEWIRENIVMNHTESVFKNCTAIQSLLPGLELSRQYDLVYMEHHPKTLASVDQWKTALVTLIRKGILGVGSVVIMAQEAAPLGIPDLLARRMSDPDCAAPSSRKDLAQALRDSADACELRVRFLRAFSPSCDYPLLPEGESICFSLVYLIEGPVIA